MNELDWLKHSVLSNAREICMIIDELTGLEPSSREEWYRTRLDFLQKETAEVIERIKKYVASNKDTN